MKKFIALFPIILLLACKNKKNDNTSDSTTSNIQKEVFEDSKINILKKLFEIRGKKKVDFYKIGYDEAVLMNELDEKMKDSVKYFNENVSKKDKVYFNKKVFENMSFSGEILYNFLKKDSNNYKYIYFEFGIKNKDSNGNGNDFKNQTLRILKFNDKFEPINYTDTINFGFSKDDKTYFNEASKALYNYGKIFHFKNPFNFAGIIFEKDKSLKWLKDNNLHVSKSKLYIYQVADADSTNTRKIFTYNSAIITDDPNGLKNGTKANYTYGNRGTSCCM